MGLFGKVFEKKECSICGGEIGLLGNRKLEDGNLCKECVKKLSPFFSDRRHSTVEQIRQQLEYRKANEQRVAMFNPTRTLGSDTKVLIDDSMRAFIVTSSSRWRDANPDVIDFSQATGCDIDVRENRTELYQKDSEGRKEHYDPPRYEYDYDLDVTIRVNSPYFSVIEIRVNDFSINERYSVEFREVERRANEIRDAILGMRSAGAVPPGMFGAAGVAGAAPVVAGGYAGAGMGGMGGMGAPQQGVPAQGGYAGVPQSAASSSACPSCNAVLEPGAVGYCPFCGSKLS